MEVKVLAKKEIDELVASEIVSLINKKPHAVLGLATGSTPVGIYKKLIEKYENGFVSFKNVKTFNLDEYIGLLSNDKNSYRYFMDDNLFNHIDINKENTKFPNNSTYDSLIEKNGGVDIQILGIGRNGHIAFNKPGTEFDSITHISELTKETIIDNARFFENEKDVPIKAITMGIGTIMKAKRIILIALGKNKARAVYSLVKGQVDKKLPASILQKHPNVTIYLDDEAASLL